MNQGKALAQNTAIQIIGKGLVTIFGILTVAVLARYLGVEGYGQLTLILAFLSIFAVIVDFGLTLTTTQMISEKKADEEHLVGNLLALRVISAVLFLALAPVIALLFPYDSIIQLGIAVGAISYLFGSTSQLLVGVFQKRLVMGRFMIADVLARGAILAGAIFAPFLDLGLIGIVWLFVAGNAIQLVCVFLFARKLIRIKPAVDFATWKRIIGRSWPIGASIFFNLIYLRGDIVFLSLYRGDAEIGLYGAAYKVVDVVTTIPVMFMGLILPMLVLAWTSDKKARFKALMQKTFDFFAITAWPIAFGLIAVGVPLMELIAGPEFSEAGRVLWILGPAASVVFFGSLTGHAIVALNKQRIMTLGYLAVAIITIASYLIFIPKYGMWAAAWWTLIAEALIGLLTLFVVVRVGKFVPSASMMIRAVIASLVMFGSLYVLPDTHVLIDILIAAAIYTAALTLLGGPKPREVLRLFYPAK